MHGVMHLYKKQDTRAPRLVDLFGLMAPREFGYSVKAEAFRLTKPVITLGCALTCTEACLLAKAPQPYHLHAHGRPVLPVPCMLQTETPHPTTIQGHCGTQHPRASRSWGCGSSRTSGVQSSAGKAWKPCGGSGRPSSWGPNSSCGSPPAASRTSKAESSGVRAPRPSPHPSATPSPAPAAAAANRSRMTCPQGRATARRSPAAAGAASCRTACGEGLAPSVP